MVEVLLFRILATVKNDKKKTVDFSRETVIFLLIKPYRLLQRCERGVVDATPFYMERVTRNCCFLNLSFGIENKNLLKHLMIKPWFDHEVLLVNKAEIANHL